MYNIMIVTGVPLNLTFHNIILGHRQEIEHNDSSHEETLDKILPLASIELRVK